MAITFNDIRGVSQSLPAEFWGVHCFFNVKPEINGKPVQGWFQNIDAVKEVSVRNGVMAVARFISAIVVLPVLSSLGAFYHVATGAIQLGIGIVAHIKKADNPRQDFESAITHLVDAVYNLAVGFLSPLIAVAFAVLPEYTIFGHAFVQGYEEENNIFEQSTDDIHSADVTFSREVKHVDGAADLFSKWLTDQIFEPVEVELDVEEEEEEEEPSHGRKVSSFNYNLLIGAWQKK